MLARNEEHCQEQTPHNGKEARKWCKISKFDELKLYHSASTACSFDETPENIYTLFSYPKLKKRSSPKPNYFKNFNPIFTSIWHQPKAWSNKDALNTAFKQNPGEKWGS